MSARDDWQQIDAGPLLLTVPTAWTAMFHVLGAVAVFRCDGASRDGFHATVTVIEQESSLSDPAELLEAQQQEIGLLTDALVLDASHHEIGGRPATRLLATHRSDDFELTLDQIMLSVDGSILTVSATVATSEYAAVADILAEILGSMAVDG